MTEPEWRACDDPIMMLEFLRGSPTVEDSVTWGRPKWQTGEVSRGNDRKFRLFACACCRRIWDQIPEECNRSAVVAVEEFLDGRLPGPEVEAALTASSAVEWKEDGSGRRHEPGYWAVKYLGRGFYKMTAGASALLVTSRVILMADEGYGREAWLAFSACFYAGNGVFLSPFRWPSPIPDTVKAKRASLADLLRCIFGNPFRPMSIAPAWLSPNVVALAETVYQERAFHRMPELADTLEEAGCNDADILGHCRQAGSHVRGCWVLDLILGKS